MLLFGTIFRIHSSSIDGSSWRDEGEMELKATIIVHESKTAPKQIPLFEEQDDGDLVPYNPEE